MPLEATRARTMAAFTVVVFALAEVFRCWIANVLDLAFALASAVVDAAARVASYRRGFAQ